MQRIRICHDTHYYYTTPVSLGPHRAMLRPRDGHDLHIAASRLVIEPMAEVRWFRDIYGNSIAILTFNQMTDRLRVYSEVDVDQYDELPIDCMIDPIAQNYPFQYGADEQIELVTYRLPSYPHDGPALQRWLQDIYQPGEVVATSDLLERLNERIYESFQYVRREETGVQLPCQTLALGTGSCRDYAVFMMEAARHWGFGARFVSGYIRMPEGQHGETHAWTEVYLPGAGWRGFDPTNNKLAGAEHVSVAVAREQEKASPLSGYWEGPGNAFSHMDVKVSVEPVE